MDVKPLVPVRFYVVGSTCTREKSPTDLDLVGAIPDENFKFYFNMDYDEFMEAHKQIPNPPKLKRWWEHCQGAKIVLESLFPWRKVDFKFIAKSMLHEPNREVTLDRLEEFR